jgi:hypothetical protein
MNEKITIEDIRKLTQREHLEDIPADEIYELVRGEEQLRQALAIGTVTASACVEDFSVGGLRQLTPEQLYERFETLRGMVVFPDIARKDICAS